MVAAFEEPNAFVTCPKGTFEYAHVAHCAGCEYFVGMMRVEAKSALRVVCAHPVTRRITKIKVR